MIRGTLSNMNINVPDVKNGKRELIFFLFQHSDSTNSSSEISNFWLLLMTFGMSVFSLLKRALSQRKFLRKTSGTRVPISTSKHTYPIAKLSDHIQEYNSNDILLSIDAPCGKEHK